MVNKRDMLRNVILAIILGAIMILIPQLLGLGKQGFVVEDVWKQFTFYIEVGVGFLILILGIYFVELIITRKDNLYGSSVCFASQGETPSIEFFKRFSTFQIFILSFIVFSSLGLFNFLTRQQLFTGVGILQQQFTRFDNLLYSGTLITISENLGGALVIALSIFGLRMLGRKYEMSKMNFLIFCYSFIPIIEGVYGVINHLMRGYSDVELWIVFCFWAIGALITLITGTFIPFWVMHINNNLFYDLKLYFSYDVAWISIFATILALIAIYVVFYIIRKRKKELSYVT